MNTLSFSIRYAMKDLKNNNMNDIVDCLLQHSSIPHSDFESVKLYGNSAFIINALKCVIRDYSDITIASVDITSSEIDPVEKDLYVLAITEELELFIQPAYCGNTLYLNEAKFVICRKNIFLEISDMLENNITVKILD